MKKELLAAIEKRKAIDSEIAQHRAEAIDELRTYIHLFDIKPQELGYRSEDIANIPPSHSKNAAKFRDPETGKEWSGIGRMPRWVKEDPTKFLVPGATPPGNSKELKEFGKLVNDIGKGKLKGGDKPGDPTPA